MVNLKSVFTDELLIKITQDAAWEALKETLRVMVLAAIPIVVDGLNAGAINWDFVKVACLIAGLRYIEKYVYERKKITAEVEKTEKPKWTGLLPF